MHGGPRLTTAPRRTGVPLAGLLGWLLGSLAGCATPVDVEPGPYAADARCAEVMVSVRDHDELADRPRRDTDAQSTAAWGDPPLVLRCGVEPPGPTTDACLRIDAVDWVVVPQRGRTLFITYGREPAVEVAVPAGAADGTDAALAGLSALVSGLPQTRECL